jgi:hypothetical protein
MLPFRELPNRSGQAYSLVLISPVATGAELALRSHLANLTVSPFAVLEGTHFVRLAMIDQLNHEGPGRRRQVLPRSYLLFAAVFDSDRRRRPVQRYLAEMIEQLGPGFGAIWGRCEACPAGADPDAIIDWLKRHQVNSGFFFAPYGTATVADVRASVALRRRIRDFAVRNQEEHPARLQERFDRDFRR